MQSYSQTEFENRREHLTALADQARSLTLPIFSSGMIVDNKAGGADFDPVTNADREAEAALRKIISAQYPRDEIIGEEFDDKDGESGWRWTLDPIDGTRAFVAGVPVWSTLIALSWDGAPIASIIDLPAMGQRFSGGPDGSIREDLSGRAKLSTRHCTDLRDVVLGCTEPFAMFSPGERAAYDMIRRTAKFSRLGLDAFGYGLLASGRMDMILEGGLKPCDIAALVPVVENAGGRITGWHGQPATSSARVVAVGDVRLLDETYVYLQRAMTS